MPKRQIFKNHRFNTAHFVHSIRFNADSESIINIDKFDENLQLKVLGLQYRQAMGKEK